MIKFLKKRPDFILGRRAALVHGGVIQQTEFLKGPIGFGFKNRLSFLGIFPIKWGCSNKRKKLLNILELALAFWKGTG